MKNKLFLLPLLSLLLLLNACKKDSGNENQEDWLIPIDEIFDGGPGKDGIPAVDNPMFDAAADVANLQPDDLVVGVKVGEELRAYPHPILDWHEIVNDQIGDLAFALTYCPLTGTAIAWDRDFGASQTTFGVSGLLYNSNLMPYDRNTDSYWSQMDLQCVSGALKGDRPQLVPLIETSWETWQKWYPDSKVMNERTGWSRNYGQYPYGDYRTNERLIFSVSPDDTRLPRKERVLGIFAGSTAKVYRFSAFNYLENGRATFQDEFEGQQVVLVASEAENFIAAFAAKDKTFSLVAGSGEAILEDEEGLRYNIFGEVLNGNGSTVDHLEPMPSYIGYWFSWGAFYPGVAIYE